jgi:ABC-type dipeptide/oligopeptide/nickel transport system permease component
MANYLLSRLAGFVFVIVAVSFVTFAIMHSVPGGPFDETNMPLSPEAKANIRAKYGLDQPFYVQWAKYMGNALQGDFGTSFLYPTKKVSELILPYWGTSLLLGGLSIAWSIPAGIGLGVLAALKRNTWLDGVISTFSLVTVTMPMIAWIILGQIVFAINLKILPYAGWKPVDDPRTLILPVIIFGLGTVGQLARFTRSGMLDVLGQDYVRTARAKGLHRNGVIFKHAMRNMLIPIITLVGPIVANIFTGSALVEFGFVIPGIGRFFLDGIYGRDYPLLMAIVLIGTTALALAYLLTDVLYTILDPRIRLTGKTS